MSINSSYRRPHKTEKGQALAEFVAVFPIAILILSIILYAGYMRYAKLAAQNATYSVGIQIPRAYFQKSGEAYIAENYRAVLDDPTGMKSMWEFGFVGKLYSPDFGGYGRLGGYGAIVGIDTTGNFFSDFAAFLKDTAEGNIPRATSIFLYSPFISARE